MLMSHQTQLRFFGSSLDSQSLDWCCRNWTTCENTPLNTI